MLTFGKKVPCSPVKVAGSVNNNGRSGRQGAAVEVDRLLDWEEGDRYSFEDSDRFEDESICSWSSEAESLCNNWRGWQAPTHQAQQYNTPHSKKPPPEIKTVSSLTELSSKCIASHIPFELVEQFYPPVPEQLQLQIAFWSFPDNEEDIRLYSCLANGSAEEFIRGDNLFKDGTVKDPLQIGFHLSATIVLTLPRTQYNVAITFDRQKISSCNCTCSSTAHWCSHIVAVCLHRIHKPKDVCLRAPVSESLQRLRRDQLQKFAQYLISELPRQILPTAQRILDELLSSQPTVINTFCGAPDPTAGASAYDHTAWYLDEKTLHNNINKILVKFCVPAPMVFSDVNYLSTSAPPAASEWSALLRPLRGREPEGMWNLLSIVREMFMRNDRNAIPLLQIITEEIMACEQMVAWWYSSKASLAWWGASHKSTVAGSQHACASLCEELVALWRLAALNPALAPSERDTLHDRLATWHMRLLDKVAKNRASHVNTASSSRICGSRGPYINGISESEVFPGFQPAIEACFLEWDDYPIPGVTYEQGLNPLYHSPFTIFRGDDKDLGHQVASSKAVLNNELCLRAGPSHRRHPRVVIPHEHQHQQQQAQPINQQNNRNDGNRSSVSSEGFCEDEVRDCNSDSPPTSESSTPDSPIETEENGGGNLSGGGSGGGSISGGVSSHSSNGEAETRWRALIWRAEGLHAHGWQRDASTLAARLAVALVTRPAPASLPPSAVRRPKRRMPPARPTPHHHRATQRALDTYHHASFLLTVLSEFPEHQQLAFKVGLYALELERPPASTKALEVKLYNQEWEIVNQLKKLPVQAATLQLARTKAEQLRDGTLRCRGLALLPVSLASFLFDVLVLSANEQKHTARLVSDETLGFEAAVTALGLKANVSEAEHPLLCEGTRRQRADLALMLLSHYRDEPVKIASIMNKLLDREIHQLTKVPMISMYYSNNPRLQRPEPMLSPPSQCSCCALTCQLDRVALSPPSLLPALPNHIPNVPPSPHQIHTPLPPCTPMPPATLAPRPQLPVQMTVHGGHNPHTQHTTHHTTRHKDSRYKGKRVYPSVPNQPSEAFAHFMFELAKSVLCKAGGTSSTSLFTQTSTNRDHLGPHRGLHMAALQLGLYALGLHNCVSANWLSRTYSSHVSWITGQAMDIGAPAILFLIEAWEGHLTPPEAAAIADRAAAGREPAAVRAAAHLALSVLPHAHALSHAEIQRAVQQCKEAGDALLERACVTVEAAAARGGVYPEVLYSVARCWHELASRPLPYPTAARRLLAAYRVGLLALDAQARRIHDDRPQNKFARDPAYGEHVKWLLCVSKQLGAAYLQQFCACALQSVASPFVLYDVCVDAAQWLAAHLMPHHLRATLAPLVHKCQQMFIQCIHQKLYHLSSGDYDEFISIVLSARAAFLLTPEGHTQFKEWLASLRRSKSCKKDLWAQLNAALQNNGAK